MPPLTLNQAVKESKKAKTTLLDAIKSGRLSAIKDEKGHYQIEPVELFRVYPPTSIRPVEKTATDQQTDRTDHAIFELKIESLQKQLEREREFNRELSKRLDDESSERRKLTALLTHQKSPPKKKENTLFKKIFKK